MPSPEFRSGVHFTLEQLAELHTRSFEGYFFPMTMSAQALAARMRSEQIDLAASVIPLVEGTPVGVSLVARRGPRMRVASMGVVASQRTRGVGRALIDAIVEGARSAGAASLSLEVIAQNEPALALYESVGFRRMRRLVGYGRTPFDPLPDPAHRVGDLSSLAAAMATEPARPWPWQLSPHTMVAASDALIVHALAGEAYACVDPARLSLRILYVHPSARRQGKARRLLASIQARHPGLPWSIPALIPEDFSAEALGALGFREEKLFQWELERAFTGANAT